MSQNSKKDIWVPYESIRGNPYLGEDGERLLMDDRSLIDKCLKGDEQEKILAWNAINWYHGNKVFRQLSQRCKSEDAYDIMQEALTCLLKNLSKIRTSILGYLSSAANSIKTDKYRKIQKSGVSLESKEEFTMTASDAEDDDESIELKKSMMNVVNKFLNGLTDRERLTFKILHLADWDLEEQATELRCIARNSSYEKDSVKETLKRIAEVRRMLKEKKDEILDREADITELSFRLFRSQELSDEENDKAKIQSRLMERRERLLKKRDEKTSIIRTKMKDISFILGEPLGTITARVAHLKEEEKAFIEENEDIFIKFLGKKGSE